MTSTGDKVMGIAILTGGSSSHRGIMKVEKAWTLEETLMKFISKYDVHLEKDMFYGSPQPYIGFESNARNYNILSMDHCDMDITIEDVLGINSNYSRIAYKYEWKRKIKEEDKDDEVDRSNKKQKVNAIAQLMISSREAVHLPEKDKDPRNGKQKLRNFVIDYFVKSSVRFMKNELEWQNNLLKTLTDSLWALDGHDHKFVDASNVDQIPDCFSYTDPFRKMEHNGLKKKKAQPLKRDDLDNIIMGISKLLETKESKKDRFEQVVLDINKLNKSLIQYVD